MRLALVEVSRYYGVHKKKVLTVGRFTVVFDLARSGKSVRYNTDIHSSACELIQLYVYSSTAMVQKMARGQVRFGLPVFTNDTVQFDKLILHVLSRHWMHVGNRTRVRSATL